MTNTVHQRAVAGPAVMFLSAAIFGYFGFAITWLHHSQQTGQFLFYVALLDYTLKASAVVFAACGVLTIFLPMLGNMGYAIAGLLSAVAIAIVALLDILDPDHQVLHPFLLILFALWNGYSAWMSLRDVLAARGTISASTSQPPSS